MIRFKWNWPGISLCNDKTLRINEACLEIASYSSDVLRFSSQSVQCYQVSKRNYWTFE